ncbi:MAG: cytochrome b [Magnetococcales bacterium]|nr:cytochrome b [Magnetococcales bacterium]
MFDRYDPFARVLHWLIAVLVIGMLGLGFYAVTLDYYDPLYHRSVAWHRSCGLVVAVLMGVRIVWRLTHPPAPLPDSLPAWERWAAHANHLALYVVLIVLPVSGYLLSTADGRGVSLFGWFDFPALLPAAKGREDWSGKLHLAMAVVLCLLLTLHVAAAIKHLIAITRSHPPREDFIQ